MWVSQESFSATPEALGVRRAARGPGAARPGLSFTETLFQLLAGQNQDRLGQSTRETHRFGKVTRPGVGGLDHQLPAVVPSPTPGHALPQAALTAHTLCIVQHQPA